MKIEQYISQLLYRHQCVTVPGFGAFLTEIQSAQLHENTNSFYPPKKLISFNSHLKNNDGLLANHIAQSEKTDYGNAVASIENEVIFWKSILQVNEKFTLKNIGELSLNAEKNIVFTPFENINYLTESFGLNSFVSPFIKRELHQPAADVVLTEKEPIAFIPKERRSRPYLKYAAVFVLSLSVAGSIGYKMYQNRIAEETLLVETAVQKQVQNKIQEATFFIENPIPSVTLTVKEEKLSYHVVAGAFRNEENAQNIYEALIASGYKARRIAPNKHGLFPVLYGSYATYAEAQQAKSDIQKSSNPDAWLLVKEL
ncbi:HU domain-containing protein [Flavobacterium psychrotolerans]|uniref:SPOR domain-containing protein n=1 Tax=Flavobacterium psychrotolerans TaxID=2169410 RepID=A0A2U1JK32_9FLAO|nr:SPOR domain-containing protein [Flavobacterium psychrotolerans]PWA05233.1 SPOR domain-containing protein [Flavobacterium psychrotolerans]